MELWKTNTKSKVEQIKEERSKFWKAGELKKMNKSRYKIAHPDQISEISESSHDEN